MLYKKSSSKLRIGIDARSLLKTLRGIPLYVLRLCQYLPDLNRDYQFFYFINRGFEHNDKPENYQPRIEEIERNNQNVTFVNYDDDAEIYWEQIHLPRLVKKYDVDVLHMPGNRICFFPGVCTIVTVHDVMEYLSLNTEYFLKIISSDCNLRMKFYKLRTELYTLATYTHGLRRASKIITVSHYSAKDIIGHLKISPERVVAIHHGVDEEFTPSPLCHALKSRKYVLMLGGDVLHKNPEGAITAWAQVPEGIRKNFPLKIIGFCGNPQSVLLKSLIQYDLVNEVEVNGWVTQNEIVEYFQNAALFLYLSRYEGFGFPLLQAMACGTPVISTNQSSLPEVMGEVGFQYDPDDHASIARGIEALLTDRELWLKQSTAGIERAKMFHWRQSVERHLKIYEEVMEEGRGNII